MCTRARSYARGDGCGRGWLAGRVGHPRVESAEATNPAHTELAAVVADGSAPADSGCPKGADPALAADSPKGARAGADADAAADAPRPDRAAQALSQAPVAGFTPLQPPPGPHQVSPGIAPLQPSGADGEPMGASTSIAPSALLFAEAAPSEAAPPWT